MRVRPDSDLALGDELKLAIHSRPGLPAIMVKAVVARDDGPARCAAALPGAAGLHRRAAGADHGRAVRDAARQASGCPARDRRLRSPRARVAPGAAPPATIREGRPALHRIFRPVRPGITGRPPPALAGPVEPFRPYFGPSCLSFAPPVSVTSTREESARRSESDHRSRPPDREASQAATGRLMMRPQLGIRGD